MKPVLNRLIFSEQCENWFVDSQGRRNVCKSGGAHALRNIQICCPNPVTKIIFLLFKISASVSPKIHSGAPNVHKFTNKNMCVIFLLLIKSTKLVDFIEAKHAKCAAT